MLFHYGSAMDVMPWANGPSSGLEFAKRTVSELLDSKSLGSDAKGLDVGCAVGRSTFELARHCSTVKGIDFSASFIEAGNKLIGAGELPYRFLEEGDHYKEAIASVSLSERQKVEFEVGDACDLASSLGSFDVLHAANLICRLPDPMLFLNRLPELVKPGGQLLLATPFTWLAEYTRREKWLGSGDSMEALKSILSKNFELERRLDMPFVIREHRRKFQFSVSLGSRWRRIAS
jgi:putative 4-mercaptohistidine N1-methyltranferase